MQDKLQMLFTANAFFKNINIKSEHAGDISWIKQRNLPVGYKACPDTYLQKLELKKYATNTIKTYVACFEKFLHYYKSEDVNLKISDIDSKRMLIRIEGAKGNKDRYTLLSSKVLKDWRVYYLKMKT